MTDTILVTGASGQLGRGVIHHLIESQGIEPGRIIAATRDLAKLADLAAQGITTRQADFDDQASLEKAFTGAKKILIVSTNELDLVSGKRLKQHEAAVAAAKKVGAERLYYTSMPSPEPGSPILFAGDHYGTEQAIKATGIPYTIFRNGWYQENLLMALPSALATGNWYTSAGDGRVAYGARDDFAAAIAAGLASETHGSAIVTLTGPQAYSVTEIAAQVTAATGKAINVIQLPDEALTEGLKSAGIPEPFARILVSFDANTRAGRIDLVTDAVETLSGRKPVSLEQFLQANKATLAA